MDSKSPHDSKLRRQRRKFHRPRRPVTSRRKFLLLGAAMTGTGLMGMQLAKNLLPSSISNQTPIRPPSADKNDKIFQEKCIRCGLCGTVCENGCIRFFGFDQAQHGALSPYIDVRSRSCTLCMRCTEICPTDALTAIADNDTAIVDKVRMGKAVVERELCLSYLGRVCGYCHDACPLPNVAIKLTPPALPVVQDACVGCGRCVECCPQYPTAISVVRNEVS